MCGILFAFAPALALRVAQEQKVERTREVNVVPAGEVVVVLNEQFLNSVLEAMLTLSAPPRFPLSLGRAGRDGGASSGEGQSPDPASARGCPSEIMLAREVGGTRTAVHFTERRITAPVAFRGSYEATLIGCIKFEGWADTNLYLTFDKARQVLNAHINVREVRLSNIPSLLNGVVTDLVQSSIDKRVNPVEILRTEQLAGRIPVAPGSALRLRATEVRHEVVQKELRLRIFYEIVRAE